MSLLVYTPKITTRFQYVFRQLFVRILEIPIQFTASLDEFVAFPGAKFSYASEPLGQEFHVYANGFLSEQGISYQDLKKGRWLEYPVLFSHERSSRIPFDLFAASFYCLSRYEEYLPYLKDEKGRYAAVESWVITEGSLEEPLVDLWAISFLEELQKDFPDLKPSNKNKDSQVQPLLIIASPLKYLYKPSLTKARQFLQSLWKLNWWDVLEQLLVESRLLSDPYANYDAVTTHLYKAGLRPEFYFLFTQKPYEGEATAIYNTKLQALIKGVSDDFLTSSLLSYHSQFNEAELRDELFRMNQLIHQPIQRTRFHGGIRNIAATYSMLLQMEVLHDLSMGYEEEMGYRASTAVPFYYYNLENEYQTPLLLHPVVASEAGLRKHSSHVAFEKLNLLVDQLPTPSGRQKVAFSNTIWQEEDDNQLWREQFFNYLEKHAGYQ